MVLCFVCMIYYYLYFKQFQRWLPALDPQSVNVVVTGKDKCTSGLINILSYDLMARKAEELKRKKFQVIIMVTIKAYGQLNRKLS